MSIERNHAGASGDITFICDYCQEPEETDTASFNTAIEHIKSVDWKIVKDGGEWLHFCSADCAEQHDQDNGQFGAGA